MEFEEFEKSITAEDRWGMTAEDIWNAATKAEREACARVCLDMQRGWCSDDHIDCAEAIRMRSN